MIRKSLIAVGIAGALVFSGSAAAFADYATEIEVTASPASIAPGGSTTITAVGLGGDEAEFALTSGPSGATLTSLVFASAVPTVVKPIVDGSASATLTAPTAGTYVVTVTDGEGAGASVTVTVAAAGAGGGTGGTLPATGSTLPAEALWIGIGALGLGAIAVTAGVARRRAATQR